MFFGCVVLGFYVGVRFYVVCLFCVGMVVGFWVFLGSCCWCFVGGFGGCLGSVWLVDDLGFMKGRMCLGCFKCIYDRNFRL